MAKTGKAAKKVETLTHDGARRRNAPTAEAHALMTDADKAPVRLAYQRRDRDLDPQLVWRGKDEQDESDLIVQAPPLYIQEKVHPKALVDDLVRASDRPGGDDGAPDLFADFNGVPEGAARTEFYLHDANWANRMVLGDALRVMGSLADRDGLRGKVQCIYIDPPYGIRFNSNFQWSTTSRDVKDGKREHITREPEQVKAFRDTWRDGIHSYLSYLRDRLTVARDLLADSGSVFVQIGDENVHRVRALMDEVFGEDNNVSLISFNKTSGASSDLLSGVNDFLLWYAKDRKQIKYRQPYNVNKVGGQGSLQYKFVEEIDGQRRNMLDAEILKPSLIDGRVFRYDNMTSQRPPGDFPVDIEGKQVRPNSGYWKTGEIGMSRLSRANRLVLIGKTLSYVRYMDDFGVFPLNNVWGDTLTSGFGDPKIYVVQTLSKVVQRCILMTTDPGDLVLDPTCGSGTTAYVAEQWGRRWITIDTSRVALALARARVMGARYPWYLLADSPEGQRKEAEITRRAPAETPTGGDVRQGFVYARVPHVTLKSIANNAEIDTIWEAAQDTLEPLRATLNAAAGESWEEWEVPREAGAGWPDGAKSAHAAWWGARIARQREIDAAIAAKADTEYLYDKPYEDKARVRVAGPFTVESLAPHRMLAVDEDGETFHTLGDGGDRYGESPDFARTVLDHLRIAGVQQAHREDRITFSSVAPWPGDYVCAEGRYAEGAAEGTAEGGAEDGVVRRAGVFIGPEFGTVQRADLVGAAREAAEAGFDVLVACAFAYDAHSTEFEKLGRVPVLKARMNADLHMAGDLKNTGTGNLFVVFGEPDIDIEDAGEGRIRVRVNGVDVFHPNTGEVRSDGPEGIACWFVDTDYDEESFFVRHAYFLGANDPYKTLKTTLKAEIDADAWSSLRSAVSRPFPRPASGRIAVKVINRLGDEAMKVFRA